MLFVMTVSDLFTNKCVVIICQLGIVVAAVQAPRDQGFPEISFFPDSSDFFLSFFLLD